MEDIRYLADALKWGDEWERYAHELERTLEAAQRELATQRIFADDFGDALARQWAREKFADL